MKGWSAYLRAAVVGFAVVEGGRALYRHRDKLKTECKRLLDAEGLKGLTSDLSLGKILNSVNSLRNVANQLGRFK